MQKELSNRKLNLWFCTNSRSRTDSSEYVSSNPKEYMQSEKEENRGQGKEARQHLRGSRRKGPCKRTKKQWPKKATEERVSWRRVCNSVKFQRKTWNQKDWKAFSGFCNQEVTPLSALQVQIQGRLTEAAARLQWFKDWIRGEEMETVHEDNLFQESGYTRKERTMVVGRMGVSMERVHAWWPLFSLVNKRWWK